MPLTAEDITFGYRHGRPVLRGVSAVFEPGAVTAVVGPNGAGKSTLLRLLLGAMRAGSGSARLDGADVARLPARERSGRLAYIPQRAQVAAPFSVAQVVRLGRFARPADEPAVEGAMRLMELEDRAAELFETLSAGQQQRVTMARAIAQLAGADVPPGGQVILADEPTSAMDPRHELHALEVLRSEARRGRAVVIVLHDFTAAARFADRGVVLDEAGRVAATGPVAETIRAEVLSRVFGVPFREVLDGRGLADQKSGGDEGRAAGRPIALIPGLGPVDR
jgi:iron complex transport system ATP-binding protein